MHLAKLSATAPCKRTDGDTQCLRMEKKKLSDSNCHACARTQWAHTHKSFKPLFRMFAISSNTNSICHNSYTIHDHI